MNDPQDASSWERDTLQTLLLQHIAEQRATRRWGLAFRMAWLILVVAVVWIGFYKSGSGSDVTAPHTALIEIRGEIGAGNETDAEEVIDALREAFEDEGAKAVVLRVNSPGGSPVHAGLINDEIKRLKALHEKAVYAVVEDSCASAAYYIAVAADRIYVDKASIVGSIGVLMDGFGFTGIMDKLGVERRLLTAGDNKGMLDPFSPLSKAQKAHAQAMLDQIHRQFIAVVRDGRGDRLKETPDLFSGLFWTGEQAIQLGLADEMGSLGSVARDVVGAQDVIDYTRRENVAERLAKRFGAALGQGAVMALRQFATIH
jgi:protease-4